ncbi:MAG: 3'-5' exonuclease domain-containing protein 2 [Prevotella sp.]|nr:3'-5' exonuclease domain-containing protein 2 [Prevotella sp.]
MGKIIYSKYDKKEIAHLPVASFEGRIIVINTAGEAERAVDYLLSQELLGIDTETRPSFRKGVTNKVSLLQVATTTHCFLFRLNIIGITPAIIRLLEDNNVPKVGLSWHDDILSLKRRARFSPGYFIDIQDMVGEIGIEDLSLQKLYANLFGMRIRKREQLSNWESDVLTDAQKRYAATDAWACIRIYSELQRLLTTKDYELKIVDYDIQEDISQEG